MVRPQRIDHRYHRHRRENRCCDASNVVTEVEETDGQTAEDDGEIEPGEKGPLVSEEDFRLDSDGERDALLRGAGEERLA